jgi:hypothetical protein
MEFRILCYTAHTNATHGLLYLLPATPVTNCDKRCVNNTQSNRTYIYKSLMWRPLAWPFRKSVQKQCQFDKWCPIRTRAYPEQLVDLHGNCHPVTVLYMELSLRNDICGLLSSITKVYCVRAEVPTATTTQNDIQQQFIGNLMTSQELVGYNDERWAAQRHQLHRRIPLIPTEITERTIFQTMLTDFLWRIDDLVLSMLRWQVAIFMRQVSWCGCIPDMNETSVYANDTFKVGCDVSFRDQLMRVKTDPLHLLHADSLTEYVMEQFLTIHNTVVSRIPLNFWNHEPCRMVKSAISHLEITQYAEHRTY